MIPELWRARKINSWACSCLNWFPMSMNSKELVLACPRILALLQCTEVRLELWHVNIWAWRNCLVTQSSLGRQNISEGLNTDKGARCKGKLQSGVWEAWDSSFTDTTGEKLSSKETDLRSEQSDLNCVKHWKCQVKMSPKGFQLPSLTGPFSFYTVTWRGEDVRDSRNSSRGEETLVAHTMATNKERRSTWAHLWNCDEVGIWL